MKKTLLFTLLALLGMSQAAAQEYEYVPFVREGVKWVYYYDNPINGLGYEDGFIPYGEHYYTLEMKGDTVIDNKSYKPMHLYSGNSIDETNDTVPVYLREEDKVVYGIIPDDRRYWECPIGIGTMVSGMNLQSTVETGKEFVLYDFNDPEDFYSSAPYLYDHVDTIQIGNHLSKILHISVNNYMFDDYIIEGLGYMGYGPGMPLNYFYGIISGNTQVMTHMSHVIENGEIVYKSQWYKEPDPNDYEYVPFVREGVKWVYCYNNPFDESVFGMPGGLQYYSFELKGDTLIGDNYYKPVVLTHYLSKDGVEKEEEAFIPVYLREEDRVVYAVHPDGIWYAQCPVDYLSSVGYPYSGLPLRTTDKEFVLYNFNDPIALYKDEAIYGMIELQGTDIITIGDQKRKCHRYSLFNNSEDDHIIEGIGFDGAYGFPLFYFEVFITGLQVHYGLSHVIEDEQVVYKGRWYDPDVFVGVDEVVADQSRRPLDENYYDLTGRAVGKDVPTTPGIYIHQGKKICVR